MTARPIHAMVLAEALPQHQEAVLATLRELADLCRQEEGCLRFDVYIDSDQPCLLNTIELWANAAALQAHLDSPLVATAVSRLFGKMRGLPQVRILKPINELPD
jgi:quinol monooxygenase YgiN